MRRSNDNNGPRGPFLFSAIVLDQFPRQINEQIPYR
jgi:hypothetical protein